MKTKRHTQTAAMSNEVYMECFIVTTKHNKTGAWTKEETEKMEKGNRIVCTVRDVQRLYCREGMNAPEIMKALGLPHAATNRIINELINRRELEC